MKHSIPRQVLFVLTFAGIAGAGADGDGPNRAVLLRRLGHVRHQRDVQHDAHTAAQQKMLGQTQAAAQSAAMQSGIRSTLSNQAAAWNQASAARHQDYRDWSSPGPATTERPTSGAADVSTAARDGDGGRGLVRALGLDVRGGCRPAPANDVIKWRPILYDRRFDLLRAEVEAPYLRNGGKPLSQPTAADYRKMIKAFQQMKAILKQMDVEITAREYLDATQDIDGLVKQATDRAERLEAAAKPKS